MYYLEYQLTLSSADLSLGEEIFSTLFPAGFITRDLSDGRILFIGYSQHKYEIKVHKKYDTTWLKLLDYLTAVHQRLNSGLGRSALSFTLKRVWSESTDWVKNWRENYKAINIAERWLILPPWQQEEYQQLEAGKAQEEVIEKIIIDPGQAFGTGGHESTRLALILLTYLAEEADVKVTSMLDVGTGSGILAIAGARLDIKEIIAVDLAQTAIENCQHNLELNELSERVETRLGDIQDLTLGRFSLVISNLLAVLIHANFEAITDKVKPGGRLILSGFLVSQAEKITARLNENGFVIEETRVQGEWQSVLALRGEE
ncbi:MAG: 50S ribosomal protein L11 methyltransferase [Bacillota bacterium]